MDSKYWDKFYEKHSEDDGIRNCSSFAKFCYANYFRNNNLNIVELGSGNGRDAIFFAKNNHNVIAIDQSTVAIDYELSKLNDKYSQRLKPKATDFIDEKYENYESIDVFYSRFTIHAITLEEEEILIPRIYENLQVGGLFCVEVRTIKDKLFGKGKKCADNTFITDHARRFINSQEFLKKMISLNFKLMFFTEEDNLSPYKDDNPVLMRIILQK